MRCFVRHENIVIKSMIMVLLLLSLYGCSSSTESDQKTITPGLYEIKFTLNYEGQAYVVMQKIRYGSDGVYTARTYNNDIVVEELQGKYKIEDDSLVSFDKQRRVITKDGTWTEWQKMGSSSVLIRDIGEDGYQYFLDPPDERAKAQYEALGLSVGWKTCKRIS